MAVYVDNMRAPYGRMIMCHMGADTTEELLAMADKIGVDRRWIQHKGSYLEHFDISLGKRELAVKFGAIEVSRRDLVQIMMARKNAPQPKKVKRRRPQE